MKKKSLGELYSVIWILIIALVILGLLRLFSVESTSDVVVGSLQLLLAVGLTLGQFFKWGP